MLGLSPSRSSCCPGRGRPDLSMQKRTEQTLGSFSHSVIQLSLSYWLGTKYWAGEGRVRVILISCCLELATVSPFFVPWHKWNSHPIFTLKLCRCGMNTIIMGAKGKTASIWPLTQVSLIPKNNRWKKIKGQWVGSKGKVACHQARRPEFEP